jgi:hypothetical protein
LVSQFQQLQNSANARFGSSAGRDEITDIPGVGVFAPAALCRFAPAWTLASANRKMGAYRLMGYRTLVPPAPD